MHGVFITGTNTGVGKTHIGVLLARALCSRGIRVIPRKPIESGCKYIDGELVPEDAHALMEASDYTGTLSEICPYRFEPPVSPVRAAHLAKKALNTEHLVKVCLNNNNGDFTLVEGAGGFYSPLAEDGLNADLAVALQLPVLLVTEDTLGCLNHVLLNAEAIQLRGLMLAGVVLNNIRKHQHGPMDNAADLRNRLPCPAFTQRFSCGGDAIADGLLEHILTLPDVHHMTRMAIY
jgi:dethiobiotin synthetase